MEREKCDKEECDEHAVMVLKLYTDDGPMYIGSCIAHLLAVSQVIENLVETLITGDEEPT